MDEATRSGGTPDEHDDEAPTCDTGTADRDDDVPACDTGPGGRMRFVRRELAGAWREWRERRAHG